MKINLCLKHLNLRLFMKKVKKDQIIVGIAKHIILKSVNDQIGFNIINFKDFKKILDKVKSICSKIR